MTARPTHLIRCGIVPPYLLERLAESGEGQLREVARATLQVDATNRDTRERRQRTRDLGVADRTDARRAIYDGQHGTDLPGVEMRHEDEPASGDAACDEAYVGLGATWRLYDLVYGRDSVDAQGLPLLATVHYGQDYDNAMWDGEQMVFGDGDGVLFNRFTVAIDVVGHELTHGVTQYTAGLAYHDQPGALNESISDAFGSVVKQRHNRQSAGSADWLIGAGLFTDQVQGVALRSMKAPGTAYDDDQLGADPQPASMDGYVQTGDDHGGVHINSGIPNHAFYLAATTIGGQTSEGAGAVWYDVLTGGRIDPECDFATFARLTVDAARVRFGTDAPEARAVADAWAQVGVELTEGLGESAGVAP